MHAMLELVELPDGQVVLRRIGSEDSPMLSLRFSDESLHYLGDSKLEVARAMIQAGIEATDEALSRRHAGDEAEGTTHTVH